MEKEKVIDVSTIKNNGHVELPSPMLEALDLAEGDYVSFDLVENKEGNPQLILKKQRSTYIDLKIQTWKEIKEIAEKQNKTVDEYATEIVKEFLLDYYEKNKEEDN